MAKQKKRKGSKWIDPNKATGRQRERYCKICGKTAAQVRILKNENICEECVEKASKRKGGNLACKVCGKVAPQQIQANNGFCKNCLCDACGEPDGHYPNKIGFCRKCAKMIGICIECGKEATAQVESNDGYCDECARRKK